MSSLVTDKTKDEKTNKSHVKFKWPAKKSKSPNPAEMLKRKSPITGRNSPPNVGAPKGKQVKIVKPQPKVFSTDWMVKFPNKKSGGKKRRTRRKKRTKKRKSRKRKKKTRKRKRRGGKKRKTRRRKY